MVFLEKRNIQTRVVFRENINRQPGFININKVVVEEGYPNADYVMRNGAIIVDNISTLYKNIFDGGISYGSFDFDWEVINPIISQRDCSLNKRNLTKLTHFKNE